MATNTTAYQRRRDMFMDLSIRSRLKEEIISQVRSIIKYPEGTVFDVILKHIDYPPDESGAPRREWTARLVWYLKPGSGKYWKMGSDMPRAAHATPEEALQDMLMQLAETQFRGRLPGDQEHSLGDQVIGERSSTN